MRERLEPALGMRKAEEGVCKLRPLKDCLWALQVTQCVEETWTGVDRCCDKKRSTKKKVLERGESKEKRNRIPAQRESPGLPDSRCQVAGSRGRTAAVALVAGVALCEIGRGYFGCL